MWKTFACKGERTLQGASSGGEKKLTGRLGESVEAGVTKKGKLYISVECIYGKDEEEWTKVQATKRACEGGEENPG